MVWVVEDLRGLASLAVVLFHFRARTGVDGLVSLFWNGRLGVHAFFVISGFVMPMALARAGYRFRDFPSFVAKRVVRLDPPYFLAILLVLALRFLPHALFGVGERPPPEWARLGSHLLYLTGILGFEWLNPVFWTLALEFQFYLALGALFPLLGNDRPARLAVLIAVCTAGPLVARGSLSILPFLPLFGLGLLALWWRRGADSRPSLAVSALWLTCVLGGRFGWDVGTVGLGTAALIALVTTRSRHLGWLGTVSYSLYLVHNPAGGVGEWLSDRLLHLGGRGLLPFLIPVLFSVGAALLFHRIIERPARRWAAAIPYRSEAPGKRG